MPGGRLSTLARAMRERAQLDAPAGPGGGSPPPGDAPGQAGSGVFAARAAAHGRGVRRFGRARRMHGALLARRERNEGGNARGPGVRVAVIGAGLAGTTAAYRLARSGVQVRLFEARDRIGGRCWTARGFADGQTAEHGGEFIDTRHVHLRGLAARTRPAAR